MAAPSVINIQRNHAQEPWGFRLSGGRDFRLQLQVKKVQPATPSEGLLHAGDAILAIGGTNAQNLTHMQAHQLIRSAGNLLQLTVLKGHFGDLGSVKPKGPVKFSPWRHS